MFAAGAGARFGGRKLLAPFADGTVLSAAIASAHAAPVRRVSVVLGCEAESVRMEARRAAEAQGYPPPLQIVAEDWANGMSASLRAGIAALAKDVDGVFVFLGDMPNVPRATPFALATALQGGEVQAVCPVHGGRRGHPALIARGLFAELMRLRGDQGARGVLDRLGEKLALVRTDDPGVLDDVDTPAALARLQAARLERSRP